MRQRWIIIALLIVLPLAVFWQTRNFDFVWDDEVNVATNRYLNSLTVSNVVQFWQKPYERLYVPITYTVWAGIVPLARIFSSGDYPSRLSPKAFHTANIVLHLLSTLLVFAILKTLAQTEWGACIGALLFALHPLQVEPVAWVTGMKDVLSGCFSLLAIWQYLLYSKTRISLAAPVTTKRGRSNAAANHAAALERKARFNYSAATVAFVAAMLAKPTAVVIPVIVLLLDYWVLKRPLRESALALAGWGAIAIPFVLVTKLSQPESDLDFITPLGLRPLIAADALAFYLYKLFLPFGLAPDYGRIPQSVIEQKWIYFTWLVSAAVAVLIWLGKKHAPWLIAAVGIFVVGFLPVSGLVPFRFQNSSTVADRYLYLSMLGAAMACGWVLSEYRNKIVAGIGGVLILVLAVLSASQARYWHNETTLFSRVLELNPSSWAAQYGLGRALFKQGNVTDAIARFREAVRLQPEFTKAHFSLAGLLAARGELDEAMAEYRKTLAIAPDFADAYVGLGNTLAQRGDLDGAIEQYRRGLKSDPARSDIWFTLGNVYVRKDNLAEAVASYSQALHITPDFVTAHNSLGRVLAARGDLAGATEHFREAVRLAPTFAEAHESLALALAEQGKRVEAQRHALEAQRLKAYRSQPALPNR